MDPVDLVDQMVDAPVGSTAWNALMKQAVSLPDVGGVDPFQHLFDDLAERWRMSGFANAPVRDPDAKPDHFPVTDVRKKREVALRILLARGKKPADDSLLGFGYPDSLEHAPVDIAWVLKPDTEHSTTSGPAEVADSAQPSRTLNDLYTGHAPQDDEPPPLESETESNTKTKALIAGAVVAVVAIIGGVVLLSSGGSSKSTNNTTGAAPQAAVGAPASCANGEFTMTGAVSGQGCLGGADCRLMSTALGCNATAPVNGQNEVLQLQVFPYNGPGQFSLRGDDNSRTFVVLADPATRVPFNTQSGTVDITQQSSTLTLKLNATVGNPNSPPIQIDATIVAPLH